jgi:hypothetical protein
VARGNVPVAAFAKNVILGAARQAGLTVSGGELQQAADRFRPRQGLADADATRQWLAARRLSPLDAEGVRAEKPEAFRRCWSGNLLLLSPAMSA